MVWEGGRETSKSDLWLRSCHSVYTCIFCIGLDFHRSCDVLNSQKGPTIETYEYVLHIETTGLHIPQVCTGLQLRNKNSGNLEASVTWCLVGTYWSGYTKGNVGQKPMG